jgi:hypothetical protein
MDPVKAGLILALSLLVLSVAAEEHLHVEVKQLEADRYELTLRSEAFMAEKAARDLVWQTAIRICKGGVPALGKYHFEGAATLGPGGSPRAQPSSFVFVQEMSCGGTASSRFPESPAGVRRTDLVVPLEAFVRDASERYLRARARGDFDQAYSVLSDAVRSGSLSEWSQERRAFNEQAGALEAIRVWRITVYENPAGAPEPGTYIAADYEGRYERIPLQCGYLIWFQLPGERFVVTREESGTIPPEFFKPSREADLSRIKQMINCAR